MFFSEDCGFGFNLVDDVINHCCVIRLPCFLPRVIHHAIPGRAARKADIGEHGFAGAVDDAADDGQRYGFGDMGELVF